MATNSPYQQRSMFATLFFVIVEYMFGSAPVMCVSMNLTAAASPFCNIVFMSAATAGGGGGENCSVCQMHQFVVFILKRVDH